MSLQKIRGMPGKTPQPIADCGCLTRVVAGVREDKRQPESVKFLLQVVPRPPRVHVEELPAATVRGRVDERVTSRDAGIALENTGCCDVPAAG